MKRNYDSYGAGTEIYAWKVLGSHVENGGVRFAVWCPDVRAIKVVGSFNNWTGVGAELHPVGSSGVWEGFVPDIGDGAVYKYRIFSHSGKTYDKSDPMAIYSQKRPDTASIVHTLDYQWHDAEWMEKRRSLDVLHSPLNIYEVHCGSWRQHEDGSFYTYKELADELIPYVKDLHYTHIELLPVMEHPLDGSWGYQITGYFSATSRYGTPEQLMYFVDRCHKEGIGVILDWVPGHFCRDAHGLGVFNGYKLYEKEDHPQWGTYKFDFGRGGTISLLLSSAVFWLKEYHADGLRVDGVTSMLFLNYGIENWNDKRFNPDGTEENKDATAFLRRLSRVINQEAPGCINIAEESSAWPLVTCPPDIGGLGFHFKWDMGWMNDTLRYFQNDFPYRPYKHNMLTFSMMYSFSENYILSLSHDEVVHGKASLIGRMPGDWWRQFAGLRLLFAYQITHPGGKLNFMGSEFGQFIEWRDYAPLDWFLATDHLRHSQIRECVRELNKIYLACPALWQCEHSWEGFEWIDSSNNEQRILSYIRRTKDGSETVLVVLNFDIPSYTHYRVGVPLAGIWQELISTDSYSYGGSGVHNPVLIKTEPVESHGRKQSLSISVPPLGAAIFRYFETSRGEIKPMYFKFFNKDIFKAQFTDRMIEDFAKTPEHCTNFEKYEALVNLIVAAIAPARNETVRRERENKEKKVYYFSMEFLIGRLLENYLINLGVRDIVDEGLKEMGSSLDELCKQEFDPGLGNGGLGRLAACFLDSMAAEGIAGVGVGLRYQFGLFRQKIKDGYQIEEPDAWLDNEYPWETPDYENAVEVHFGGRVERTFRDGKTYYEHKDYTSVKAVPYDVPIVGYNGDTINMLHLFRARPVRDNVDMDAFNRGDYAAAMKERSEVDAITCILYPDDSQGIGRKLRLKQEYFMVSAGIHNILKAYRADYGSDWESFPNHVSIHINDTHPTLCIPELMRVLMDVEGLGWDKAWEITQKTVSFTNHTVLPEALEKWDLELFRTLLPRIYMIVEEINKRYNQSVPDYVPDRHAFLQNTSVINDNQVKMANLSIIGSHHVNGVAALHTDILKESVFKNFNYLYPDRFSNKTNGISHRRFLIQANPALTKLITETIGDKWLSDPQALVELLRYDQDKALLEKINQIKIQNKEKLAEYILRHNDIKVDPTSVFDIQVKRIHAYKRQLLNAFKVLDLYHQIKDNPGSVTTPVTFIFSGKAAQGYAFAKEVIKFINSVADLVNADPEVSKIIKVVFIENFCVSNAQVIYPGADISEQISTAGKEASGTGNMKFMMNGAITLGTLDGANVEIRNLVGDSNIRIFGLKADEAMALSNSGRYSAAEQCKADPRLAKMRDELVNGFFKSSGKDFWGIHDALMQQNDEYLVLRDFDSYMETWKALVEDHKDIYLWNRMALNNIGRSGYFSSDRTISEYAKEIWNVK